MPHIPPVAMVITATVVIIALLALFWWLFIERPDRRAERDYQPRHTGPLPALTAGQILKAKLDAEADDAYAAYLHRMNTEPVVADESEWERNVGQWSAEHEQWRRAMNAGPSAVWQYLATDSLSHAWWTGR